jgi:hypothetical protein
MMRVAVLAAMAAGLAACSPGGVSGSEAELAAKIVDAEGVLDLGEQTINAVVGAQLQGVAMQTPNITPEQGQKLEAAIRKNIEAELPALKKEIAGFLDETFEAKELQTYANYVASKEGDAIKERMPVVMQKSLEAADAMTMKAVNSAMAEVVGAAPGTPTPPDPAGQAPVGAAPAPAAPPNPTKPQ